VMRTPGRDVDLVTGFLVSEGVVQRPGDLASVRAGPGRSPPDAAAKTSVGVVDVELAPGLRLDLERLRRNVYATSSCGVCGKAAVEEVLQRAAPLPRGPAVSVAFVRALPHTLRRVQPIFDRTGGAHAACVVDAAGAILGDAEDVGRHNAVDKAIGAMWRRRAGMTTSAGSAGSARRTAVALVVSGRVSFEVVQKALVARIPLVCAISAPTSLAVAVARAGRQTLIAFLRGDRFNVYAGADRIGA